MERSWRYRVVAYSLLSVLAIAVLLPSVADWTHKTDWLPRWFRSVFTRKIALGLDLRGGLHLVYEVQADKAVTDKADRLAAQIEEKLVKDRKVKGVKVIRIGEGADCQLKVSFEHKPDVRKIDSAFHREFARYITEESRDPAKGEVVFRLDADLIDELRNYAVTAGVDTIKNRVDSLGVAEPVVQRKQNDIIVELAGLSQADFERVKNQIGRTAQLEFKIVDDGSEFMQKLAAYADSKKDTYPGLEVGYDAWTAKDSGAQHTDVYLRARDRAVIEKFLKELPAEYAVPPDHEILLEQSNRRDDQGEETQDKVWRTYYLHRRAELTGEYLTDAEVQWDPNTGRPEVSITFDAQGADLFEKVTGSNVGRRLAIILDNKVTSAPTIEGRIGGGRARITLGGFSDPFALQQEARDLVAVLRNGALPAPLRKTFETQVGPTLGTDQVARARTAMIIGTLWVILFMLIYYRAAGLVANIAMIFNVIYLLAVLALLQATLTLPGIAAVVLTIGMAVDANIIIYERIREELRAGKTPRGAVEAGFARAFWTVFDAHVTNLVAGIVLYSYGTGPIRGFAVSLMAGIVCNLFTSVWLSRVFFDWMVGRKKAATLSI
ncbi:MAG: protein translocase subunit SecD [Myxococcales bacterium]|nr:protein translocase subunit SecD [Myxococcota bacterium]MDW8282277.1 protein translocase subunit SecD [Myxococcales bacterium]